MSSPIVDVQNLQKTYSSFSFSGRRRVDAVRGVSLQADAGEVFGLLGPNGAGKTTLIKMLLGVVQPSGGSARLFGEPIGSTLARSRVGYLPESLRVDRHHTARTALRYYGRMSRMSADKIASRSDELLELVGLMGRDRESVKRFSKGMYQRLGLAQALMHDPDLLVLDEPTDGLDPVGRNEVRVVIERLRDSGKTIFLNSHILQEVELVCTRVAILAKGTLQGIGTIDELSHSDQQTLIVHVSRDQSTHSGDAIEAAVQPDWAAVFGDQKSLNVQHSESSDCYALSIDVVNQEQIDWVVDRLRRANLSIAALNVKRESLEQTFIRLVGDDDSNEFTAPASQSSHQEVR